MTTLQMKARRGEVWLVRFPFTNLSSTKLRPAIQAHVASPSRRRGDARL